MASNERLVRLIRLRSRGMDLLVDWYKRRPGKLRETLPPEFSAAVLRRIRENAQQIHVESNEPALGNRVSSEGDGAPKEKQGTSDADETSTVIHMAVLRTPGSNDAADNDKVSNVDEGVSPKLDKWPRTWRKSDFGPKRGQRKGGSDRSLPLHPTSRDRISREFLEDRLIVLDFTQNDKRKPRAGRLWRRYENDSSPMIPRLLRQIVSRAYLYGWLSTMEASSIMTIVDEYEVANRAMRKRYRTLFRSKSGEPPKVKQEDFEPSIAYLNDPQFHRDLQCAMDEVNKLHEERGAKLHPQELDHFLKALSGLRRKNRKS